MHGSRARQYELGTPQLGRHVQDIKRTSELAAPIMRLEGHEGEVFTCKFSPDGDLFASAGHDKSVLLWRPLHPECENFAVLRGHKSAILELHWTPDNERIVTASPDTSVRAWDVGSGLQIKNMAEHTDVVNSCHCLRRGAPLVVSGSEDTTIKVRIKVMLCCALYSNADAARACLLRMQSVAAISLNVATHSRLRPAQCREQQHGVLSQCRSGI